MIVMPSCHGFERFRQVRIGVRVRVVRVRGRLGVARAEKDLGVGERLQAPWPVQRSQHGGLTCQHCVHSTVQENQRTAH